MHIETSCRGWDQSCIWRIILRVKSGLDVVVLAFHPAVAAFLAVIVLIFSLL